MNHVVHSRFEVRSYEVDSYSHLNNGVFLSWYEQGRLDYLRSLGYSYDDFAERGEWFVVRRTEVEFHRPLHVGDCVVLETRLESFGRTSARFGQLMRREHDGSVDDEPAAEATTVMVFTTDGRSIPIPADFRHAVERDA